MSTGLRRPKGPMTNYEHAYEEGERAFNSGETHGDNPYPRGTKEHEAWAKAMSNDSM